MIDEARVGRAIVHDRVELTVDEYSTLLAATAWRPVRFDDDAPPTDQFIIRCWEELSAIDAELASRTFDAAKHDGASPITIVGLAGHLNQENPA